MKYYLKLIQQYFYFKTYILFCILLSKKIVILFRCNGSFKNFLRMSSEDFENLINLVGHRIAKKNTNYREAIPVRERLAITLRFLASGDSYHSLMYLFKVSKQSISIIVPSVCDALNEVLKEYLMVDIKKCIS